MILSFHLMLSSRWILSWSCGSGCKQIRCLRNINARCCWWCCNRGNHWGWRLSRHNGWLTIFGYIIFEYHRKFQLDWDIWVCLPCPPILVTHLGVAACDLGDLSLFSHLFYVLQPHGLRIIIEEGTGFNFTHRTIKIRRQSAFLSFGWHNDLQCAHQIQFPIPKTSYWGSCKMVGVPAKL